MIEVRFHGRGGQGVVVASELLAAAAFHEQFHVAAFPFFGVERRGAPVTAYTRIDSAPIRIKSGVYEPDYVVVLDSTLLRGLPVLSGLKPAGSVLVNSPQKPQALDLKTDRPVFTVDATHIAAKHRIGSRSMPIVNTAILGAFPRLCPQIRLPAILASIEENSPAHPEWNVAAAKEAYESVHAPGE